jgi:hypothetical protein
LSYGAFHSSNQLNGSSFSVREIPAGPSSWMCAAIAPCAKTYIESHLPTRASARSTTGMLAIPIHSRA